MNREQKAATIVEIADQIEQSQAILAVDYRGITVTQIAELRTGLRQSDTTFRVVKNSLTERAADQSGAEQLKPLLVGPTALAFVRGDVATAAKVVADYGRSIQMLPFKGGLMDGATLDGDQLRSLSRLPPREVLYGQLVGVVASPVTGLVRSLNALLGGLAVALGQVRDKMQSGEIKAGAPDAPAEVPEAATETKEEEAAAEAAPAQDEAAAEPEASSETEAPAETEVGEDTPSAEAPAQADPAEAEEQAQGADAAGAGGQAAPGEGAPSAEASAEAEVAGAGEPAQQPDQQDDQAEASSEAATDAAAEPAKEE